MAKKVTDPISQDRLSKVVYQLFDITKKEKSFILFIAILTFICGIVSPYPHIAMWVGFALAGYSAIANDSIQTIGTFIASNHKRPWWILWLFMGLIFVATITYSWIVFDGDVSHQRLTTKGFDQAPTTFSFLQLAAPILLLVLTRLRMPVSTSVLLLSSFSTQASSIGSVLSKSLFGYVLAFITAIVLWFLISKFVKNIFTRQPSKYWMPVQWVTSGALWAIWIIQDAANIAIFLPRSLSTGQYLAFIGYIFLGLGVLFFLKGDKIQNIVNEKAGVADVRAATIVDMVYAILLFYFKVISTIPISTTWVFIGLLGGRELAISLSKNRPKKRAKSLKASWIMVRRDVIYALIGLALSIILALAINSDVRNEIMNNLR